MFKYAMCNECMKGMPWPRQCDVVAGAGYRGIEIAPFSLVNEGVEEISSLQRQKLAQSMEIAGLRCTGLHWLFTPPPEGMHFTTPDESVRRRSVDYLDKLIDFCADLQGRCMVFGSPNQRSAAKISVEQAKQYFMDGMLRVADHAEDRGVKILIESLSKDQTNVINTLAEAVRLIEKIGHPAIRTMFDFHNTADETEPADELIRKYHVYIDHVHVQEMDGQYLGKGTGRDDFVPAFQALKDVGYDGWISLEVFDFSPGHQTIARESIQTLKQIEGLL